jgi:hypothetical protein
MNCGLQCHDYDDIDDNDDDDVANNNDDNDM